MYLIEVGYIIQPCMGIRLIRIEISLRYRYMMSRLLYVYISVFLNFFVYEMFDTGV